MTNPQTPESSERKLAEELRALRFLGEYGSTESLPNDYVDRLVSFFASHRAAIVQETLRAAGEIVGNRQHELYVAAKTAIGDELEDIHNSILALATPAILERVAERERQVREAALEEVAAAIIDKAPFTETWVEQDILDIIRALKNNPTK